MILTKTHGVTSVYAQTHTQKGNFFQLSGAFQSLGTQREHSSHWPWNLPDLELPASRTGRNPCLLFERHPVDGTFSLQPEQPKTQLLFVSKALSPASTPSTVGMAVTRTDGYTDGYAAFLLGTTVGSESSVISPATTTLSGISWIQYHAPPRAAHTC